MPRFVNWSMMQDWRLWLCLTSWKSGWECRKSPQDWFNMSTMNVKMRPSYSRLLLLMRPGPRRMNHRWNTNQMSGIVTDTLRKVTVQQTATNMKAMLIIAYDWDGVIIKHTIPQKTYYHISPYPRWGFFFLKMSYEKLGVVLYSQHNEHTWLRPLKLRAKVVWTWERVCSSVERYHDYPSTLWLLLWFFNISDYKTWLTMTFICIIIKENFISVQ